MAREVDIAALGELLIDFTEAGYSKDGMKLFEQNPGGAPANLLTVASHMGYKTAFIGKVGTDMHGAFLKKTLQKEGIDTTALIEDEHYFTTLAFVEIDENGERNFSFARKPGADTQLRKEELDKELLRNCKIFHFGSLSLTDEPARSATLEAVKTAKETGALISYDPNYRASLWENEETAIENMRSLIPYVDIMKISDEEIELLTGYQNMMEAVEELYRQGVKIIAVTLGGNGAYIYNKEGGCMVPGFTVEHVADTNGAGDSFWGGFLYKISQSDKQLDELTQKELAEYALFGNAVASLCVEKKGAIPAMPKLSQVEERLEDSKWK